MDIGQAAASVITICPVNRARTRARLLTRYLEAALRPSGLTADQFALLSALAAGRGPKLKDLAQTTGHEVSTLSRSLKLLDQKGYIHSRTDEDDRRKKQIGLTVRGEIRLEQALELWQQAIAALPKDDGSIGPTA